MPNIPNTSQTDLTQVFKNLFDYTDAASYIDSLEEMFEAFLAKNVEFADGDHRPFTYTKMKMLKEALATAETLIQAKNAPNLPPVTPPPTSPLKVIRLKGELQLTEERKAV